MRIGKYLAQLFQGVRRGEPGQRLVDDALERIPSPAGEHEIRNLPSRLTEGRQQFLLVQRGLEDVVHRAVLEDGFYIFKVAVAAQHNDAGFRIPLLDGLGQGDPIHHRHDHIRQHNLRLQFLDPGQGFLPIGRFPHDLEPLLLPMDHALDPLTGEIFILNDQDAAIGRHPAPPPRRPAVFSPLL